MKVLVGTSGYNYAPWFGPFYPDDLPKKKMLGYYASRFPTVEINYSFYRKPTAKILANWAAQVPPGFRFALKAWQRITHHRRLRDADEAVRAFAEVARTLGPRLAPILFQVPPNLKVDLPLLRDFLARLPRDLACAFEFRHESWFSDATYTSLADCKAALCVADAEELTTPLVRTVAFGYFRLRRARYTRAALGKWAAAIAKAGFKRDVFVYFKHEDTAAGVRYAKAFLPLVAPTSALRRRASRVP